MLTARSVLFAVCATLSLPAFAQPTFSNEVSRILQAKCAQCHREGDIAPFPVANYDAVAAWADDIKREITDRIMPPWKPVVGYGEFRDSYALTDDEKKTILDWIDAGAPEGDPADLPPAVENKSEWPLGDPDQAITMAQEYIPPRGTDVYRCFVMPATFDTKQYLTAIDVVPGNRQLVHHVLLFTDTTGQAEKMDGQDGQPGYSCFGGPGFTLALNGSLGGWAPGQRPHFLPDGIGIEIQQGARIVMQVHYFPVGRTGSDQTKIGLYYSKKNIQQRLFMIPVVNTGFKIPANNPIVPVSWGERATDEMCLVFLGVTFDYEKLLPLRKPGTANR